MNRSHARLRLFGSWIVLLVLTGSVLLAKAGYLGSEVGRIVLDVRNGGPNDLALDRMTRNYYEQVIGDQNASPAVPRWMQRATWVLSTWVGLPPPNTLIEADRDWAPLHTTPAMRRTDNYLNHELRPNVRVSHKGVEIVTNRWGMRDDDCSKLKPPGVFRIALVGGSNTMGSGVDHKATFEALLEQQLNKKLGHRAARTFEILNFSVSGYFLDRRLYVVNEKVVDFDPDLIIVVSTMHDVRVLHKTFAEVIHQKRADLFPYPYLKQIAARAGVAQSDSLVRITRKLAAYKSALINGSLRELSRCSERTGIPIALAVLRLMPDDGIRAELRLMANHAESTGLIVLRVFDAYEGRSANEMYLRDHRDRHPGVLAHRLLADNLYEQITQDAVLRRLLLDASQEPRRSQNER